MTKIVDSICAFANSHLMLKPQNKIAVIACNHQTSQFIYPTNDRTEIRQIDGQHEMFLLIERSIKTNIADLIQNSAVAEPTAESMLAGCLAMCLCYITRVSWNSKLHEHFIQLISCHLVKEKSTSWSKSQHKNHRRNWK